MSSHENAAWRRSGSRDSAPASGSPPPTHLGITTVRYSYRSSRRTSRGPAYIAQAFQSLLEKSRKKTIVNISSTLGSVGSDFGAWHASYSVMKAGLNMLTYKLGKERLDITVISMCPGWLQTDMSGPSATLPVSVGVSGVLQVVQSLTPEKTGKYYNFKGEEVPW